MSKEEKIYTLQELYDEAKTILPGLDDGWIYPTGKKVYSSEYTKIIEAMERIQNNISLPDLSNEWPLAPIEGTIKEPNKDQTMEILRFIEKHDIFGFIFWDSDLEFDINCNDTFYYASADAETFTVEDLPLMEECINEIGTIHGLTLFIAIKRKMLPLKELLSRLDVETNEKFLNFYNKKVPNAN